MIFFLPFISPNHTTTHPLTYYHLSSRVINHCIYMYICIYVHTSGCFIVTHQRTYVKICVYKYTVYAYYINDLQALVGLICFATEWKKKLYLHIKNILHITLYQCAVKIIINNNNFIQYKARVLDYRMEKYVNNVNYVCCQYSVCRMKTPKDKIPNSLFVKLWFVY